MHDLSPAGAAAAMTDAPASFPHRRAPAGTPCSFDAPYPYETNRVPSPPMDVAVDPDAQLMLAYARGDLAAFEALYAKHRGTLYRFVLRSVRDRSLADEVFQDTWSRVIAARSRYQPQAKFSTWLLQIAHHLIIDGHRRKRPLADGDEAEIALAHHAAPAHEQPEHALSDFEQRRGLQRAIEQLPDDQRTAVLLRLEHELSLEEIAQITGVGRETVKSRLRYAMTKLRDVLSP